MESPESSSPIITRAVSAALRGQYANHLQFSAWQSAALRVLGRLPQAAARWIIPRVQGGKALDAARMNTLTLDDLVANRLKDYDALPGPFPAVVAGVGMGGATAHLATLAGGPYLPQAFVFTLRGGASDGDARAYYKRSADIAQRFAQRNPAAFTIQHYDPIHDGWLTRHVNHLRVKLVDLPEGYRRFLRQRLAPGGEVICLDGGAQWLRYRTGERSVFQVGGWGDISPEEYLEDTQRILAYCRSIRMPTSDWKLDGFPLERGPESEWGSEPGFRAALERFCAAEGYRFTAISLPHPEQFSLLAFHAMRAALEKAGQAPSGVIVETFSQYDATAVLRSGLLPLWLIFNTQDSRRLLQQVALEFPAGLPLFFSPLSTFSLTPDMAAWEDWLHALAGRDWINIGARRSHYPADTLALLDWYKPLRRWVEQHPNPVRARLTGAELLALASKLSAA